MRSKYTLSLLFLLIVCGSALKSQTVDFTYTTPNGLFCNPQSVTFTQACSGSPTSFIWSFGNGQSSTNPVETTNYASAGTYTVTLTAIYTNDAYVASKTVVISPTPIISLTADKNYLCQPGNVNFTATGSAFITSYEWNFGDGSPLQTTATNTAPHNYAGYGQYTATVKGITANGCSAMASYSVQVSKFGITGNVNPTSGCIPVNATIIANTNLPTGDATQNFAWDFGDGSPIFNGAIGIINHLYNTTATISNANVTITSVQGCTNQFTFNSFAYGTPPFGTLAKTVSGRDTFCSSETIQFFGKAVNANSYTWSFGDGTSTTVSDTLVSHLFYAAGANRVIVTPFFNGCAGVKDTVDVFIKGPFANFTFANTCGNKNTYTFTNLSFGTFTHFEWTFSDNPFFIDSVNYNPVHTFPPNGFFTAVLNLKDNASGCAYIYSVNIFTAQPVLSRSTGSICKDSLITYRVSNTYDPSSGYTYEFHVNGTVINNAADSVLKFYPISHGNFADYVVIKDNNTGTCNDTLQLLSTTQVKGPVIDFTVTSGLCADKAVTITNNTFPFFNTDTITKWKWNFGDNKIDSVQNPEPHLYTGGNYTISLIATDINGCGQTFTRNVLVSPLPQISAFPAMDTICQSRDTSILRAYTTDTLLWMPAVNINCNDCDTIKAYPFVTTSYIARATNSYGCISYDTCLVKVYAPINLGVFPADTTVCPLQPVRFNLNAIGKTLWSPAVFLNNTTIKNPIAVPDSAITYTIIVQDSVGCYADTVQANIHLYPKPTVDAGPDIILPYYTSFTISPAYSADVTKYLWTPAGNLNCTSCAAPSGIAVKKQTYSVQVTSNNGCKATDDITIFVECQNSNLLLPTAFTPNNDGRNDWFYPIARGYRIIKSFVVYNRLGTKVFERSNFSPNVASLGWDGNVKNNSYGSSTETFVWYVQADCDLGQLIEKKGTVVLIR